MLTTPASPATIPPCPLTKFTWGLDLSGQNGNAPPWQGGVSESPAGLHGAGGIGGLLAMTDTKGTSSEADDGHLIYFYDANGNVGQVMDVRAGSAYYGQAVARYEYYPFGGILASAIIKSSSGPKNPFMFSTKYRDSETGLYYSGYRYLLPRLGRWLNRDPIGELGGQNLYEVIRNDPVGKIDPHGLCSEFSCGGPPTSGPSDDEEYVTAKPPAGSEPGRFWPVCCKFLYDICMHDCPLLGKKGYRKCPKELQDKNCADICEKAKNDCLAAKMENPCHAGHWLDYYCRFIEGAEGDDVCTPKRTRPHSFNQFKRKAWMYRFCDQSNYDPYLAIMGARRTQGRPLTPNGVFLFCTKGDCLGSCLDYCDNGHDKVGDEPKPLSPEQKEECKGICKSECGSSGGTTTAPQP